MSVDETTCIICIARNTPQKRFLMKRVLNVMTCRYYALFKPKLRPDKAQQNYTYKHPRLNTTTKLHCTCAYQGILYSYNHQMIWLLHNEILSLFIVPCVAPVDCLLLLHCYCKVFLSVQGQPPGIRHDFAESSWKSLPGGEPNLEMLHYIHAAIFTTIITSK